MLGTRSFGLVGDFTFVVGLTQVCDPAYGCDNPATTPIEGQNVMAYRFHVSLSANVDARLFGISFAGIGFTAEARRSAPASRI